MLVFLYKLLLDFIIFIVFVFSKLHYCIEFLNEFFVSLSFMLFIITFLLLEFSEKSIKNFYEGHKNPLSYPLHLLSSVFIVKF